MPGLIKMSCQRFEIQNGDTTYPYLLGAMDAKDLKKISDAPSFEHQTPNQQIASEVLVPPTQHWQRPIIQEKVNQIAQRFDQESEIMPNPVLLAVNPSKNIVVSREISANGVETGLWTVEIPIPDEQNPDKPLWIIDGQHRVAGLAQTNLSHSPLPFVLLHSSHGVYLPGNLAKIFAQVTTEATPLNPIHEAWMQFVFQLGRFSDGSADWKAMKTTALLCKSQMFSTKQNAFYDKIGFNPELPQYAVTATGGFSFDAKYLQELLREYYFKIQGGQHYLNEESVAEQIALALHALKKTVLRDVNRSAFFAEPSQGEQKYFRDGFIAGVCSYLLENGKPTDWDRVLSDLKFPQTNWDVSSWVNSTSGRSGTVSKKIAFKCFTKIFADATLPNDVDDLCSYFAGQSAVLKIEYQLVDENDEIIPRTRQSIDLELSSGLEKIQKSLPVNARHIKITSPSANVGPVTIALNDKPYDETYSFNAFRGRGRLFPKVEVRTLKNKIVLNIKAEFYGDNTIKKQLTLTLNG